MKPTRFFMIQPTQPPRATIDANEAVASVAYRLNDVFAIYPITPSSPMGEWVDEWAARGQENLWGVTPQVVEMQSEGGAAGALHGALQGGALASSFTASQGLLLMIPNMYKIAGELHPCVLHVTARTLATHALSIFGDHSDVMACRQTGFALLAASSVQESQDLAAIAYAASLRSRIPYLHFFDGFRTSHEVNRIDLLTDEQLRELIRPESVRAHRERGMTPDRPQIRGTAQNPDVFFQAREAINPFYIEAPRIFAEACERFAAITGRRYGPFAYEGHPEPERVIIAMGSGVETAAETALHLSEEGERVGVVNLRLYRPFPAEELMAALPSTVKSIAVLDRTKEPGAGGDPLFLDVVAAAYEAGRSDLRIIGGRYGLGSKEFTPAMAAAVFGELKKDFPRKRFTVGINDDVTRLSLDVDPDFDIEPDDVTRAVFYGLGADGTVGANKNTIKIIGDETGYSAQGFFVYDSKKSGAVTVSHLRFGERPIRAPYLISRADFVACHQFHLLDRMDVLAPAAEGGVLLLNAPSPDRDLWSRLSVEVREGIRAKKLKVFAVDALKVARDSGLAGQINTVMQTCFFALTEVLPVKEAIGHIKETIRKSYGRKGESVVNANVAAVDGALASMIEIEPREEDGSGPHRPPTVAAEAPDFVQRITARMLEGKGDELPVSVFPPDGSWPVGTARWEKRNIGVEIPVWDPALCIQCNKCAVVCPHAAIRAAAYPEAAKEEAPETFKAIRFRSADVKDHAYTIQVAPEDCTGCSLCAQVCPARDKSNLSRKALMMAPQEPLLAAERENFDFFLKLPPPDPVVLKPDLKGSQFNEPLFEFSGACAGCGETPYLKLLTQLYGDRLVIANATGCSSIYGGNLPTTPYTVNRDGRGPAWSNSLFEDNAEYGLGLRLGIEQLRAQAGSLLRSMASAVGRPLVDVLLETCQSDPAGIARVRQGVTTLRKTLAGRKEPDAALLSMLADHLVEKSVWIVGGDGWAYDIGYGGLDHVLASNARVRILVLDTEVYSNTGGQRSKSTPLGAVAKFSMAGKDTPKKDLALLAASYGNVYVGRIALGARDGHALNVFREAEAHDGPSLILAFSPCIAHGYSLSHSLEQEKLAVDSGYWPLLRYQPARAAAGENPWQIDSPAPKVPLSHYMRNELRFRLLEKSDPARAASLAARAQEGVTARDALYRSLAVPKVREEAKADRGPASKPATSNREPAPKST